MSQLNGQAASRGSYSINTDTSYYNAQVLQLNNFVTRGIFSLFTVEEVGMQGQVRSSFDGMFMKTSNDTLILSGAITPAGSIGYIFVKQ